MSTPPHRTPPVLALVAQPVRDAWVNLTNEQRMIVFNMYLIIGWAYPEVEKGVNHCKPRVMMPVSLEPKLSTESKEEVWRFRQMTPEARGFAIEFGMWSMYVCPDLQKLHNPAWVRNSNVVASK